MISSKTNILKSMAMTVAMFALSLFAAGGFVSIDVNASGLYPTGDMHTPPEITEIFPENMLEENDQETSEKNALTARNLLGAALDAIPVDTGEHYKYLSDAEKVIYDAVYRSIISGNYIPYSQLANAHNYPYLDAYKTLVYSGESSFQTVYGISNTEYSNILNRVSEAIYFDHPDRVEFYMCHPSHFWQVNNDEICYSYISLYAGYDETQFALLDEQIGSSLSGWINELKDPDNNCVDKNWDAVTELKVHDYYASNLKYDQNCASDGTNTGYFNLSHTAYGALCKKNAVCDGYSAGFSLIMKELGIEAMIIAGYARGGHAWNIVRLDGAWYEVDTTWAISNGGVLGHDWFNRTTAEYEAGILDSSKAHVRRNNDAYVGFRMPKAYGKHYTYAYLYGTDVQDLYRDGEYIAVEGISLSKENMEMTVGERIVLEPVFKPENATIKDYTLSTNNYDCLEANGNTLSAVAVGTATITVTSKDGGFSAKCIVTVKEVPKVIPRVESPTLEVGSEIKANSGVEKDIFVVTSNKNATVSYKAGKNKNVTTVNIPATITDKNGSVYTVTGISAGAFKGFKKLKKVTIPNTVKKIGKGAFANCPKLSVINIRGDNLSSIGSGAFKGIRKGAKFTIYIADKKKYSKLVKKIKKAGATYSAFKFQKKQS